MPSPQSVPPIATTEPRKVVGKVPCPRPGCGGEITLTAGAKGNAWGYCKKPSAHVGKTGKPNVCGSSVTLTAAQTRALLEGERAGGATPSPERKAMSKTIEVEDDEAEEVEKFRQERKAKRAADKAAGARSGNDPAGGAKPRKRVGFFEYD